MSMKSLCGFALTAHMLFALMAATSCLAELPPQISGTDLVTGSSLSRTLKAPAAVDRVIVFLSSKCPCSKSHEPKLAALAREFAPQGVEFVGIHSNVDEPESEAHQHFKEAALPFPVLQDSDARLANAFGALKTPHAYILRGDEILYQGGVDSSAVADDAKVYYLRDALLSIKLGKKPDPGVTRCLGCMIKRN